MKELSGKGIGVAVLDTGAFPHMDLKTGYGPSGIIYMGENRPMMTMDTVPMYWGYWEEMGPPPEENTGERLLAAD